MANEEIPQHFYLIRYNDYTLDVAAVWPTDIESVLDIEHVRDALYLGTQPKWLWDRDWLYK